MGYLNPAVWMRPMHSWCWNNSFSNGESQTGWKLMYW